MPSTTLERQRETAPARATEHAPSDRELAATGAARSVNTAPTSVQIGPGVFQQVKGFFQKYAELAYKMPWETLDIIEVLSQYNPDLSQAAENVRTLANSGFDVFIDGGKGVQKRVNTRLDEKMLSVQALHGGIPGLVDKLLRQAATFGAMAGEWVLTETLDDVVDFADVNPKTIRFFWDEEHWAPYQKVTMAQAEEAKNKGRVVKNGSYLKLNELTFHYFAFDAAPGSPYGVPPFLAALGPLSIQRDMIENMSQIVKKVGLLGIIDLVIKSLPRKSGETDAEYQNRAGSHLDSYVEVVQDTIRDGGIVHFDDVEMNTTSITGNAAGATNIFKQNEEQVFSGLKSMPSVQGRSYSTTETYAGVAYDIIIRNTARYQRGACRMLEIGFWLMCMVWGENPEKITVTFKPNKTLHRLQEAQSEEKEIRNAALLWLAGAMDQVGFCQRLGFSAPKREMELPPPELVSSRSSMNVGPGDEALGTSASDSGGANSGTGSGQ